jgi:putative ABC transport system permease protein
MRLGDIFWLSLSALYQQKLRTLLTTLGVLFGSLVLVFSLSMGRGVQETIVHEYSRYAGLRQIEVNPSYESPQDAEAENQIEVKGVMSQAKRQRLRRQIRLRRMQEAGRHSQVKLTPELLYRLHEVPHVKSVTPEVDLNGRVILHDKAEEVSAHSSLPDNQRLIDRIVAGEFLSAADKDVAVVTEHLLYRLGIADDAAVQAVLGQKLRLEYRTGVNKPNALLMLLGAGRSHVSLEEAKLLDKLVQQLPATLDQLDLTSTEKELLRKILQQPATAPQTNSMTVAHEFIIVGVLRGATKDDPKNSYLDWWTNYVDVVLPVSAAVDLFFEVPANHETGLTRVIVEANRPEDVKEVTQAISALGVRTTSLVELIEREQFTYLLLFGVMTCIAAISLLVAALGIINTMSMSVLERTREIGVMKAVGARSSHIQSVFLVEGALIGLTGGLLGLLASWAISLPSDAWVRSLVAARLKLDLQESLFVWPAWLLLGTPLFTGLVTTLAAVHPARRAAAVDPITALRHE